MRHPNWSGYPSESAMDFAREDQDGAALVEPPTPEQDAALSLELDRENAEAAAEGVEDEGEDGLLFCDWCSDAVRDSESIYAPYCSPECEREATRETYASIHPRPEEVG